MSSTDSPLVTIRFNFNGEEETPIVIQTADEADINSADDRPHSFRFTGRHDHGDLPTLKSTGHLARLVTALQEAKYACDVFLTTKIEEEKSKAVTQSSPIAPAKKKSRGKKADETADEVEGGEVDGEGEGAGGGLCEDGDDEIVA